MFPGHQRARPPRPLLVSAARPAGSASEMGYGVLAGKEQLLLLMSLQGQFVTARARPVFKHLPNASRDLRCGQLVGFLARLLFHFETRKSTVLEYPNCLGLKQC